MSDSPRVCIVLEVELATPTGPGITSTVGAFKRGIDAAKELNVLAVSFDWNDLHCFAYADGRGIAFAWEDDKQIVYHYEHGQITLTECGNELMARRAEEAELLKNLRAEPRDSVKACEFGFAFTAYIISCAVFGYFIGTLLAYFLLK